MKRVAILLVVTFSLTGCARVGEYIWAQFEQWSAVPASLDQNLKSEQLYTALQQHEPATVKMLVSPSLQTELNSKPKLLSEIMQMVPNTAYSSMEIVNTTRSVKWGEGKTTAVVYAYHYPNTVVYFSVVFDGMNNGTDIIGFHVNTIQQYDDEAEEHDNEQENEPHIIEI